MDKNKIIEGAAKLVAKGAYDKAIKEYQKVLDVDPTDVRVLQKMGELYQKKSDNPQAAHFFTKVAESYAQDGFFLKAVALYKQVLKLNPDLVEVNLKLAELHQQLGLMTEAMAYFQVVVAHHDEKGDTKATFDTLKKMVDLDPENVVQPHQARRALRAREDGRARRWPSSSARRSSSSATTAPTTTCAWPERIASLEPDNVAARPELAHDYLARGDQKRALAKLQVCFKADPRDVETLNLLAQAFQALGQTCKTVSRLQGAGQALRRAQPGTPRLADAWGEDRARSTRPTRTSLALEGEPAAAARRRPRRSPAAPAPPPGAAPSLSQRHRRGRRPPAARRRLQPAPPRRCTRRRSAASSIPKLLTETDVYVKYGLHDKALEHLRKHLRRRPREPRRAREGVRHLRRRRDRRRRPPSSCSTCCASAPGGPSASAPSRTWTRSSREPGHPEVPAFLAVLRPERGAGRGGCRRLMARRRRRGGPPRRGRDGRRLGRPRAEERRPGAEDELLAEDDEAVLVDERRSRAATSRSPTSRSAQRRARPASARGGGLRRRDRRTRTRPPTGPR